MKDKHFTSRMLACAGALMSISGILIAICVKIAYSGILFAAAACMFFAAHNFRVAEDQNDKEKKPSGCGNVGEIMMEHLHQDACPCKRVDCPRHGDCAACREHHHASYRKPLTRCEKLARKEQRKAR